VLDECGGILEGVGIQAAAVDAAVDFALEQARGFKDAKVLGNGGQRHVEWSGERLHRGLALRQAGENGTAGGVGEGAESSVESGVRGC